MSELIDSNLSRNLSEDQMEMYERVWDEAEYVVPPSENNAFFIMTNAVITPNQTRGRCPEDHFEIPNITCSGKILNSKNDKENKYNKCVEDRIYDYKSHGSETGDCIKSDRGQEGDYACEIRAWCPVELDILPMSKDALLRNTDQFTVLLKNSISFPWFDADIYRRDNMPNGICKFDPNDKSSYHCPIFQLGDIVRLAGGIYEVMIINMIIYLIFFYNSIQQLVNLKFFLFEPSRAI